MPAASQNASHAQLPASRAGVVSPPRSPETSNANYGVGVSERATADERERFLPVTRFALIDRLTEPDAWPAGQAAEARRFFRYLDYWRQQQYGAQLLALEQDYEPFSPDSDLLMTRTYTPEERKVLQRRVVEGIDRLLTQANYTRINPQQVELILTQETHYGLDLHVDLDAFEELLVYYRGATTRKDQRRSLRSFLRKQEIDVPIFRRLFVLFKLKSDEQRIGEIVRERGISRRAATRAVRRMRSLLAPEVKDDLMYMKLFKNIPRSDIEMVFPNTRVNFRPFDKVKLGITSSAGLGMGAFSAAGKLAVVTTNPLAAAGAAFGLGGIIFRQCKQFLSERQRYMVIMAQNLYFHAMADNRGVLIKLASRAAEEDTKEEMLLYAVLARASYTRADLPGIDRAIEQYMADTFGVDVDFEIEDALGRLIEEGIVAEGPDGSLTTLPPAQAATLIDQRWDVFLDKLSTPASEGVEMAETPDLSGGGAIEA